MPNNHDFIEFYKNFVDPIWLTFVTKEPVYIDITTTTNGKKHQSPYIFEKESIEKCFKPIETQKEEPQIRINLPGIRVIIIEEFNINAFVLGLIIIVYLSLFLYSHFKKNNEHAEIIKKILHYVANAAIVARTIFQFIFLAKKFKTWFIDQKSLIANDPFSMKVITKKAIKSAILYRNIFLVTAKIYLENNYTNEQLSQTYNTTETLLDGIDSYMLKDIIDTEKMLTPSERTKSISALNEILISQNIEQIEGLNFHQLNRLKEFFNQIKLEKTQQKTTNNLLLFSTRTTRAQSIVEQNQTPCTTFVTDLSDRINRPEDVTPTQTTTTTPNINPAI